MKWHKPLLPGVVKQFESDARLQAKIHLYGTYFWLLNFPFVAYMFFGQPSAWVRVGLVLNTFYSLYANFATDYGALSAAQASQKADPSNEVLLNAINEPVHRPHYLCRLSA